MHCVAVVVIPRWATKGKYEVEGYFSKAIRIHPSDLIGGNPVDLLAGAYNLNILRGRRALLLYIVGGGIIIFEHSIGIVPKIRPFLLYDAPI